MNTFILFFKEIVLKEPAYKVLRVMIWKLSNVFNQVLPKVISEDDESEIEVFIFFLLSKEMLRSCRTGRGLHITKSDVPFCYFLFFFFPFAGRLHVEIQGAGSPG